MKSFRACARKCVVSRAWCFALLVLLTAFVALPAQERKQAAGKLLSPAGTLLARTGKAWQSVPAQGAVSTGDLLLALPGDRAEVQAQNGAVQLSLWGNLPELYDFPILETAVVLQADSGRDLTLSLERGRIVLTQQRSKPTATVRVAHHKNVYDFILSEPGTQVAIESFGRWPSGAPVIIKGARPDRTDDVPTQVFLAYMLKGSASLRIGDEQFLMPPLASFRWDNVVGRDQHPRRNSKMPAWFDGEAGKADSRAIQAAVERFRGMVAKSGVDKAVADAQSASDAELRRLAVFTRAALDDLSGLVEALSNARQPDVRGAAFPALQHWIGKGPTQDVQLYNLLVRERMFTPNQAEIVLHLLHGFRETERDRPETVDHMVEYLRHSQLPIRELASAYLNRWLPAGRKILYDAGGSQSQIDQGYQEWKKLIATRPTRPSGR